MKIVFRSLILGLAFAAKLALAISVVQMVGFQNGQSTTAISVPIAATGAGDALILCDSNYVDTKHPTSFVAGGTTVSTADNTYSDATDNYFMSMWSMPVAPTGTTSVTVNMSATAFTTGIVVEVSGLASSSMLDAISAGNRQSGVASWNTNSVTTTQSGDLSIGCAFIPGTGITFTAGSGWTIFTGSTLTNGSISETTATTQQLFGEYEVLGAASSYQATGGGPNNTYISMIGTYKVASGGACTHSGATSAGAIAIPNGTTGSFRLCNGTFGAPDCSTVIYKQMQGACGVN